MSLAITSSLVALVALLIASSSSSFPFVSARGFFYQVICSDSACTTDCQYDLFQEDACYIMNNGESGFGQCVDNRQQLVQENFAFSQNCTGLSNSDVLVSGHCYSSGAQFVKFDCNTSEDRKKNSNKKNNNQQQQSAAVRKFAVEIPPKLSSVRRVLPENSKKQQQQEQLQRVKIFDVSKRN